MRRLGINGERLLVYLNGFQNQLTAASADLAAMLAKRPAAGGAGAHRPPACRLRDAGPDGAATAPAKLRPGPFARTSAVQAVLAETVRAVMHQSEAWRGRARRPGIARCLRFVYSLRTARASHLKSRE
jgi:two-component system chemotaxis response regulator CheY